MTRRLLPALVAAAAILAVAAGTAAGADARTAARYKVQQDVLLSETTDWQGKPVQLGVDVYLPERTRAPLLIWLHGGGFVAGSRREGETLGRQLAPRGYAVASISYRLRTTTAIRRQGLGPAMADVRADIATAVAWARENAALLGIDPRRIAIGGHSAGAVTALDLATSPARLRTLPVRPCLVVSVGGGIAAARARAGMPPVAFFHAVLDPVASRPYAFAAYDAIRSRGVRAWFVDLPGDQHTPNDEAIATVLAPRLAGFLRVSCTVG